MFEHSNGILDKLDDQERIRVVACGSLKSAPRNTHSFQPVGVGRHRQPPPQLPSPFQGPPGGVPAGGPPPGPPGGFQAQLGTKHDQSQMFTDFFHRFSQFQQVLVFKIEVAESRLQDASLIPNSSRACESKLHGQ